MRHAACAGQDPELFVPRTGRARFAYPEAVKSCVDCTVRTDCLEYALVVGERLGVWGGLTPNERRPLHQQYRRLQMTATTERPALRSV